jgi:sugar transferase (PEP-CTERM/EpsH1 system associated)
VRAVTEPALIAHVINRLDFGGLENGVVNLVNGLPPERFRHAILCLSGYTDFRRRIRRDDVPVLSLEKQPGKDPAAYLRMWRLLRTLRPQVLHTRNVGTVDMQWVGWAAGVPGRVHGEHGWTADDPQGLDRRRLAIRRACRPVVHRWMAMSQDIARWLERDVRVPASRVRQLYSGVDAQRFSPDGASATDAPWPASAGAVTVGTIGRLDPVKNQRWLLESCHAILERHPELRGRLRLIIAGDGPVRGELQQSAERLGIGSQVWLPGARSDVPELMRSLDVFVLPSRNEGSANTILEAMAGARPVVAARVGGNAELVAHEATGLLYEPGDRDGLAQALARYAAEPELRVRHGRAARERVLERFSLEGMVRRYADFYDELLARGH